MAAAQYFAHQVYQLITRDLQGILEYSFKYKVDVYYVYAKKKEFVFSLQLYIILEGLTD